MKIPLIFFFCFCFGRSWYTDSDIYIEQKSALKKKTTKIEIEQNWKTYTNVFTLRSILKVSSDVVFT